ncbi:hypothetical protein KSP39_PZI023205 [Platanthera zijinensis]|uniref:Uncharacterized protein n=1 Tax=Platanthera zijinensis TaxID=2320716 RepID=A0AAP0FUU1_9ASPA
MTKGSMHPVIQPDYEESNDQASNNLPVSPTPLLDEIVITLVSSMEEQMCQMECQAQTLALLRSSETPEPLRAPHMLTNRGSPLSGRHLLGKITRFTCHTQTWGAYIDGGTSPHGALLQPEHNDPKKKKQNLSLATREGGRRLGFPPRTKG